MTLRMRQTLKWVLWVLLLLFFGGVQSAPGLSLGGIRPVLLLTAAVSVALMEKNDLAACGYCIFAGLLWDVSDGRLLGFYALVLLFCCIGIRWLVRTWLRQTSLNAIWLSTAVTLICGLWNAEFYLFIWGYAEGMVLKVLWELLLQAVLTGLFGYPVCLLMRLIRDKVMGAEESRLHRRKE